MSFPKYAAYKDSGVEWIGEIPVGWNMIQLKRIISVVYGDSLKNEDRAEDGSVPVYGSNGVVGFHNISNTPSPTIMIGRKGSCGALNWSQIPAFAIDTVFFVELSSSINMRWVYWLLHVLNLASLSQDIGVPGLSRETLYSQLVTFPPFPEQQAIASFLDRECGKIDALIAEQERLIALLAEKRQAVISHAVTKGLNPNASMKDSGIPWIGMVPEGWEMKRIKDCGCRIVDCKNRTPENHPAGKFFVVRTSCIKDGVFIPDSGYFTDETNFVEWTEKGVPQFGDVLFTREAPAGEACLAPENIEFCLGQRMMFIRPLPQILSNKFLLYSIYGGLARERIIERSKGSTVGHLRVGDVGALPLLLPPYETQLAIVDSLEGELSSVRILTDASQKSIVLLKERRAALISAAVTGKIDVRAQSKAVAA
ncbi:restriction endonuclease subunit S [Acetobacter tropicalis]|uniref:Type I restriction-modification system, specificity subunit S n=1 Tax=Acetobacter tropicalis TaxID=104102 RepID=A0A094ZER1_9PROT|nr:restriction endonuclease subunit S [Acetobacter tropicalis]KAA8387092.1 restriction endonuclease subunit S [Acetobacter tropicalis]KAA8391437.1 restriction endonuclease subunit S [Acetobacter tropicalis]KGB21111.1 Type I restriction-modification system, specificity subunit S [Acetobacter tropicalis]MBC9009965.1 restriction endonuclease subunit S [Acetobacter tropicalis]MDO8171910.1 restriction endonuclease subunit S [Acetobacter tropicalis]